MADDYRNTYDDTTAPLGTLDVGTPVSGEIEASGDRDVFEVTLIAGRQYTFNLKGTGGGGGTLDDSYLYLLDSSGSQIASDDDSGAGADSSITFFVPVGQGGTYYLAAAGYSSHVGTYTLEASVAPDTTLLTPIGTDETRVNEYIGGDETRPSADSFADGSYIVVFRASATESSSDQGGIYFQRYDADGNPVHADGTTAGADEVHVNTTTAGYQTFARVTVLSDDQFVVTWTDLNGNDGSSEGIYAQLFAADGTAIGSEILVNATTAGRQTQPTPTATADGGFIIAWASDRGDASGYVSFAQRFDSSGNFVAWDGTANGNSQAETQINTSTTGDQGWTYSLALAGDQTMFLYSSRYGGAGGENAVSNSGGGTDVYGKIYNLDGSVAVDEFRINSYLPSDQYWPHATVLSNGDVVVTWMSYLQDGSGQGIFGQIVHPDGTFVGSEFQVNTYTGGDQEYYEEGAGPHITALNDGGFVVVWHSYQDSSDRAIMYQRYDAQGNKIGGEVQANQIESGDQSFGDAVATADGFTIVWDSQNQSASGDTQGYGLVARHFALETVIAPTGGEDQVNTHTSFKQEYSEVATASDGSYVIVWQGQTALGSDDAGDSNGWGIYGQRYNADGSRAGGEFLVNETKAGDQQAGDVVYLDGANDGRFVVTWTAPGVSGTGIYARVYNADGTAASGEFLVNANTANDQGPSAIAALHGTNAGGFIITWTTWFDAGGGAVNDIYAQTFDAAFNPVGGEFRVTTNDGDNTSDDYETGPSVIGTPDGGYIIQWNDSGSDGSYDGVLAKRYDASGAPLQGTNPDGSAQNYAFQVNTYTNYQQDSNGRHHALGAFADGSFVTVWQSGGQDGSGWGVYAQVYNADGTILTPEFRVNGAAYSDQSDAQVAVLADGSFVVVWTSNQTDQGTGEEIYAKRFDANGNVLNQEFQVNITNISGDQRWPSVAATADGFVVTWTDQHENAGQYDAGADGQSNGVFKQQFTIDQLNATAGNAGTAHKPVVTVEALTAHEVTDNPNVTDNAAALHIVVDADPGAAATESTSVEIAGIPAGATLSDGTHTFTATVFDTATVVDGWNLSSLTITPALDSEASFTLTIRATSTDSVTLDTETTVAQLPVTIAPVALPETLDGPAARVNSTVVGNQDFQEGSTQNPLATWSDGSYVIVWTSHDGQDGSDNGVYAQKFDADGNPLGGEIQVNSYTNSSQASPSVATLADGSFVVTWESYEQAATQQGGGSSYYDIFARTFDAAGNGGAEVHVNSFTSYYTNQQEPSITVLADGGYLIAWQSSGQESGGSWGTYAQRFDAAGNMVSRDGLTVGADEIHLNQSTTYDQNLPVTTALQDGGWLAVWNSNGTDGYSQGIYAQRFDSAGNIVHADGTALAVGETGAEFLVNTTTTGAQQEAAVVTLSDGGWVIAWQDDRTDGSSWGVYAQVYNSDGSARGGQFLVNSYTGSDQSQVSLAAGANGGFYAVYHSYHDADGYGIYGQQFDAQAQKIGQEVLVSGDFQHGTQIYPHVAATSYGVVVAWQSNYYYGPADPSGNDSPNTWGIFARRMTLSLDHISPTGGENQVNSTTPHEQQGSEATTLSNGDYVIVWQSEPSQSSAADHDISDWGIYGQIFHADGTRVGGEFVINSNTDGDQSQPDVTALDNGGFVVVWNSATGAGGSGYDIYGQRFDNAGAALGSEFMVNSNTSGTQGDPAVQALHGANADGFVVTWDTYDADVYGRVFDASGAGTPAAVGNDFSVNLQEPDLNGGNSAEHHSRIAADADGNFTVVWHDDSSDQYGSGIFGQRFTVDLTTGAVAATGTQPDGTAATDNFRVNHDTYANQWNPDIAALTGGGYVAVWQSDAGDDSGSGIRAQLYNADGTLNGTEFQINLDSVGNQYEPRVLALSDGTFVVAWRSNETGANGVDIYANHFAADGHRLDDQFRVNATTAGDQTQIALAESDNGFVVSWTSPNQDGSSTGVFAQRFVIDPGAHGGEVAADPTLTVSPSEGDQDSAIPLHIDATLNDGNGATPETLQIEISNIPAGATIADGAGHSFTSDARVSAVDVAGWNLAQLTITPPTGSTADFTLTVRATATEPDGDIASVATTAQVTVDTVVPPQAPYNVEFTVDGATGRGDMYPRVASFADGSFVEVWQTNGASAGHGTDIVARLFNADGTPQGAAFYVTPAASNSGYYNYNPAVAVLADGTFAVSFESYPISGDSGYEIRAQRFSSTGEALKPDGTSDGTVTNLLLSTGTDGAGGDAHANDQGAANIVALADGSYIVVWQSRYEDTGTYELGIYATHVSASGTVLPMIDDNGATADVIHVSHTTAGDQSLPSVIQLADGRLVFSYDSADANSAGSFYRIYDATTGFGAETQINSYATNSQSSFYRGNTLTALADGGFAAVWASDGQDGSSWGVYGEVFNADGTVRHAEFQVSSYALNQQQEPQITSLPDGGFMAVWTSNGQDGSSWGVYGQRFDAAGDRVGTEFRLNTTVSGDQSSPAIAVQSDGSGVIVTWEDNSVGNKVVSERIPLPDASTPQAIETAGAAQQVNVTTADQQTQAAVVKLADGSYVVAWQSYNQDGSGWGVYARHYDAAGHSIQWTGGIDELLLSTSTSSNQTNPKLVALSDGSFIAGWQDDGSHGGGQYTDVFIRHIGSDGTALSLNDASGTATTSELRVDSTYTGSQSNIEMTALTNGGVAITWASDNSHDGSGWGVYGTQLTVVGGELQLSASGDTLINTHVAGDQYGNDHQGYTAALTNGEYVVVWQSDSSSDGSGSGIYGQLMNADGTAHGSEFLINTETAGSQVRPSVAALTGGGFVVVWDGDNLDGNYNGVGGQLYDASGNPVGGQFQIDAVAQYSQYNAWVEGTQDGGFVVAFRSDSFDGSGSGIALRRFDSNAIASDPYGDDVLVNVSYSLGDQDRPAIATLDNGLVVVWQSNGQDGSSWGIEQQRFQGAGLEPPPLTVDKNAVANGTTIFNTIQDAIDAAHSGDIIEIVGGVDAAHTVTFDESLSVTTTGLTIRNRANTFVEVQGSAGNSALELASGDAITIKGDATERLVFNAGANAASAIHLGGSNDGSVLQRATVNAGDDGAGGAGTGSALLIEGGQNGILVQFSDLGGHTTGVLADVLGASTGAGASTGVSFQSNSFEINGGTGLSLDATGSNVKSNAFNGTGSETGGALVLLASGDDVEQNTFGSAGTPHILDPGSLYSESTLISQNSFAAPWVWDHQRNGVFSTMGEALAVAQAGDYIETSGGSFAFEATPTVGVDNLTVSAPGTESGIELDLGTGVTHLTLSGNGAFVINGNDEGDTIHANDGTVTLNGGAGNDTLTGGYGADTINGGGGTDTINILLGNGLDTVDAGGDDDDTVVINAYPIGGASASLSDSGGTVTASVGGVTTATIAGAEVITYNAAYSSDLTISGFSIDPLNVLNSMHVNFVGDGGSNTVDATGLTGIAVINSSAGDDTYIGGPAGFPTLIYTDAGVGAGVIFNLSSTSQTVGATTVASGTVHDEFGNTDTVSMGGAVILITGDGDDSIWGGGEIDILDSGAGTDVVHGGDGADVFKSSAGTKDWYGDAGDDSFFVSNASITVHENAGEGTDTVVTDLASYTLTANVENLTGTSAAGQTLTGNDLGNVITTDIDVGNDTVDAGDGDDTIVAGYGMDSYTGGAGVDTVDYSAFGTDAIHVDLVAGTGSTMFTPAVDTLVGIENVIGTDGGDTLAGDALANSLDGGDGDDTLFGRGGADVLTGGAGNDEAQYLRSAADGLLHRDGSGGYIFNGGASEGTDTLTGIETIRFAGANGTFGDSDDRVFAIVGGNVALQVAADTGSATEAGGLNNATAAVNATGNVLNNDINLDEDLTAGDHQKVTSIVWNSATGPGSGDGTTTSTAVTSAGVTIQGRYGSLTIAASGAYTYTPDATKSDLIPSGTTVTESFTYGASDGIAAGSTTTLTISLHGSNDTPVASDVSTSGGEDAGTIASTLSATDADQGTSLTYALVAGSVQIDGTAAADGTVTVNANGSYSYSTGAADNALNAGESRTITFSYTASDGSATSPAKTATITVNGANDAPTAVADTSSTGENTAKTVDVLANDTDPDTSHVFTLDSATAPVGKGTASVVSNQVHFDPGTAFDHLAQGAHEDVVVNYTMEDDNGATSSSTLTITVNGVNDAPTSADASISGSENDASIDGTLTGHDVDDGTTLTFGLVAGSVKIDGTTAADGTVTVNSDGTYSYAPGAADNALNVGEHRTITFDFSVGDGITSIQQSATITVNGANDAPTANADTGSTGENTAANFNVLANDTDPDTSHVFTLDSATAPVGKGTASVVSNQVHFDPGTAFDHLAQGAHEDVVINYTMEDDNGATSSSTLTITVNGVNDAPTSADASISANENDASIGGTLTGHDVDDGTTLTFGLVAGSVKIDGTTAADGTVTVNSDGTYNYVPGASDNALNVGEHRTITFDFSVGDGITSIQQSATITVNGANDAPTANADTGSTGENTAANFNVLANDTDPDTSHVFTLDSATAPVGKGTASVVSNQVHFDPGTAFDHLGAGAHEDVVINYTMEDDNGATSSSTLTVTVNGANDAPTAASDAKYLNEDTTVIASSRAAGVLGNDSDKDDGETATLTVVGAHSGTAADTTVATSGTTSIVGTYGTLQIAADGTYRYTADSAAAQALAQSSTVNGYDVFRYTAQDAQGATVTSTLTFNIKGQDDAPVAHDDALTTTEDASSSGSLFADHGSGADSDVDGPALSISSVNGSAGNVGTQITLSSGALLTVNANGSYDYDPNGAFDNLAQFGSGASNQSGNDSFTYTLTNGNTATVTIDIHGVASTGDRMEGSPGDDTITGTSMDDLIMLQNGGQDSATGGDGDDGFYLGAALTPADTLDGGAGDHDQLGLQGDYSVGLTLGANNLVNTEMLVLLSGSDARFGDVAGNLYSYAITTVDENVLAGQQLAVSWNNLHAGEDVTFDGSAENDGSFLTFAGRGVDTITGGQQNDSFYFGYGMWGASDSVDGQGGTLDELGLQGNYTAGGAGPIVFGATQLSSIEMIVCMTSDDVRYGLSTGEGYSYDLTMDDANVAAGQTLYISANKLMAADGGLLLTDETLTFDGSHESDGNFVIYSGFGADHIVGGAGDDVIFGGGGADTLTGGAGNDTFAYRSFDQSTPSAMDHILDFTSADGIELSAIDAIAGGDDDAFTLIDGNPFSHTAGELRYEHSSGNDWLVQGDVDGDGNADFQIMLTITDGHALGTADFVL